MRRTTQQTLLAINLASQQKTTKLYFSSQVGKQFKLLTVPFTLLRCCWRSGEVVKCISMFENSAKIYFKTFAWFDPSIKSYLFMVSSRILLRSLRVYILKQYCFQSRWIVALGIFTEPREWEFKSITFWTWLAVKRSFPGGFIVMDKSSNGAFSAAVIYKSPRVRIKTSWKNKGSKKITCKGNY